MKNQLLCFLMILLPLATNANAVENDDIYYDIEIDGIYYNLLLKDNIAEVTLNPNDYNGNVVIPESVNYEGVEYKVKYIGDCAFMDCHELTSITIPNSVTLIGEWAFMSCGLTSVHITDLADWCNVAFCDKYSNPLYLGSKLFLKDEEVKDLMIPNGVTKIRDYAFIGFSSINTVTIPDKVTSIGECAFSNCTELTSITIPNSVTTISYSAFSGCSALTTITFPNGVTSIEQSLFYGCTSLTSFTIPNSVSSIGNSAFFDCSSLTTINIPNSVTSIDLGAFQNCKALTSITIPHSVTKINEHAFSDDTDLITVISLIESPFAISWNTFSQNTYDNATLYVPVGTIDKYKETKGWKNFANILENNSTGVTAIKGNRQEDVIYYSFDGKRIEAPKSGTAVIKKTGSKSVKVFVK